MLLAPRAAPTAGPGHRAGCEQQRLLSVFPISGSQHGSADPGNAVQELVQEVRPQQCCGWLCCQIGLYYFIFSVKFMGWGFCRTWHWDLISNEDLLIRKFDLMQPSFIASRIKQNKVALPVHVQKCLPEARETPCGSCDGRAKRGGTFH